MMRVAASRSLAFKSFILAVAMSDSCERLILPPEILPGSFEPDLRPAAFLIRYDAGGVLVLDVVRIWQAALDRTDRLASLVIVETDALGAELGIDDVDLLTLADGFVRTLRLASAAVDAVCGDVGRHGCVL